MKAPIPILAIAGLALVVGLSHWFYGDAPAPAATQAIEAEESLATDREPASPVGPTNPPEVRVRTTSSVTSPDSIIALMEAVSELCEANKDSRECKEAMDQLFGKMPAAKAGGVVGGVTPPRYDDVFVNIPRKIDAAQEASRRPECAVAADEYRPGNAEIDCAAEELMELAVAKAHCLGPRKDDEDHELTALILREQALAAQSQEDYARRIASVGWEVLEDKWRDDKCETLGPALEGVPSVEWFTKAAQLGEPYAASRFARTSLGTINMHWYDNAPEGELLPEAVPVIERMYADTKSVLLKMAETDPVGAHAQLAWFIAEREPRVTGQFIEPEERLARQTEAMTHLIVAERLDQTGRVDSDEIRQWITGFSNDLDLPPNDMSLAIYKAGLIIDEVQN